MSNSEKRNILSYRDIYQGDVGPIHGSYTTPDKPCNNCGRKGQDRVTVSGGIGFERFGGSWQREHTSDDHCTDAHGRK